MDKNTRSDTVHLIRDTWYQDVITGNADFDSLRKVVGVFLVSVFPFVMSNYLETMELSCSHSFAHKFWQPLMIL